MRAVVGRRTSLGDQIFRDSVETAEPSSTTSAAPGDGTSGTFAQAKALACKGISRTTRGYCKRPSDQAKKPTREPRKTRPTMPLSPTLVDRQSLDNLPKQQIPTALTARPPASDSRQATVIATFIGIVGTMSAVPSGLNRWTRSDRRTCQERDHGIPAEYGCR